MRRLLIMGLAVLTAAVITGTTAAGDSNRGTTAVQPKPGAYRGKTQQSFGLTLKVRGRKVTFFATSVQLFCRVDGTYNDIRRFVPPGSARLRSDGSFRRTVHPGNGVTYKYWGRFTGGGKARGRLTMGSSKLVYGGLEVCVTPGGNLRWRAKHR